MATEAGALAYWMYPGTRMAAVSASIRTATNYVTQKLTRSKQFIDAPAAGVYRSLGALLQARKRCLADTQPSDYNVRSIGQFDGVPTVGGELWRTARQCSNSLCCVYCRASAGCCSSSVGASLDVVQQFYSCGACY